MSKSIKLLMAGLLLLAGCLPSLNAIYRNEDLIFDPAVLGEWTQVNAEAKWTFTQRDAKCYRLVFTDNEGRQGRFAACLADIQGKKFLDLFPEELATDASPLQTSHFVPVHTIYLVESIEPNFVLKGLDITWLDQLLTRQPELLSSVEVKGHKLVTATTEELQAFVIAHPEGFVGEVRLERLVK